MLMNIRIELDTDERQTWYTNHEWVKGRVCLELKSSLEVSKINVCLYGISETSLVRIDDFGQKFTDQVQETSTLLSLESPLFPPAGENYGAKYSLRAGVHEWPFGFEFPRRCTAIDQRPLPPSLSDIDKDLGYIKYFLRATVNHSSSMSLRTLGQNTTHSTALTKSLIFLPSDDSTLDTLPTYGVFQTTESRVVQSAKTMSGLFSRLVTTLAHDRGPCCSNVGIFTIRSELLLTPGLKFSCVLEAVSPANEEIQITALRVQLVARTHIRAKNVDKTVEHPVVLCNKYNLNLVEGDLLTQLHDPVMILPDSVPPTFCCGNLRRDYRLEFRIKWSHLAGSALVHKATLSRKVHVRSGMFALPNYETGEIIRANREFPQAKWYYNAAP